VIGVASHWTGLLHADMLAAFSKGDVEEARRINARLIPSYAFESGDTAPNPIPAKCVMRLLGLPVGLGRPPMDAEPLELEGRAQALLDELAAVP
jgi:4-hydroxy-tetrahydrodipicolinate synthase